MKIERVRVFQVDLPLKETDYSWSGQKGVTTFDSTVVAVDTDAGITGYGEVSDTADQPALSYRVTCPIIGH